MTICSAESSRTIPSFAACCWSCPWTPELGLGDGTHKVFINSTSASDNVTAEMRALLDYLCGRAPGSDLTRYIDDSIAQAKSNKRWEREDMFFAEMLREEHDIGYKAGIAILM